MAGGLHCAVYKWQQQKSWLLPFFVTPNTVDKLGNADTNEVVYLNMAHCGVFGDRVSLNSDWQNWRKKKGHI